MNRILHLFAHSHAAESPIYAERVPKIQIIFMPIFIIAAFVKIILNFRGCSKNIQFKIFNYVQCSLFLLNCYFSAREWFDRLTTREWLDWLSPKKVNLFMHIPTMNSALNTIKTTQLKYQLSIRRRWMEESAMRLAAMPERVAADFFIETD